MGCNSCGCGGSCGCGNNWWWIIILILVWLWLTGGNATNISAYRTCGRRYSALTNSVRNGTAEYSYRAGRKHAQPRRRKRHPYCYRNGYSCRCKHCCRRSEKSHPETGKYG